MQNFPTAKPRVCARLWLKSLAAAVLASTVPALVASEAVSKTPGSTYCFYKTCHRVKSLAETQALVGKEHTLPASFYDDCSADRYNPCGLTSSGEVFRPNAPDNAASPIYPDGTKLLVWSPDTQQAIVLRINNAGPYWGNRKLDVSRAAAEKLGFKKRGVANLSARILEAPSKAEATYKKGRNYAPVAGDIGRYTSASAAQAAMSSVQMVASATLAPFNGSTLPSNLVSEVMPASAVAVAALTARPKLPDDAIADAKSLVALAWPVVRQADVNGGNARTASLEPAAAPVSREKFTTRTRLRNAGSWSQRVSRARLIGDNIEKANRVKPARKVITRAPGMQKSRQGLPRVMLAAAKPVMAKKLAYSSPTPVVKVSNAPEAKLKFKQAAIKPALKTSALMLAKTKPRA